jgi:hypothetical protein
MVQWHQMYVCTHRKKLLTLLENVAEYLEPYFSARETAMHYTVSFIWSEAYDV